MSIHIGNEIKKVCRQKMLSSVEIAKALNTGESNIKYVFQRPEILTGKLMLISECMEYDFFQLYKPFVPFKAERAPEKIVIKERMFRFTLDFEASTGNFENVGRFIAHVTTMAEHMGIQSPNTMKQTLQL